MGRIVTPALLLLLFAGACSDSGRDERPDAQPLDAASEVDAGSAPDATTPDAGADAGTPQTCGNGVLDDGESCDPALSACCNATCEGPADSGAPCRAATNACDAPETCDGVSLVCPDDGLEPDGTACSTCPLSATGGTCAGCFSGECLDRRAFCSDILARGQSTGDGVYTIRPAATSSVSTTVTSTLSVFCDMTTDEGGWTMVFKKSRVVPGGAEGLWTATATNTELLPVLNRELASVDYTNAFAADYWGTFTEARVEVVTGTVAQQFIQFDLVGTTPQSWFAPDRHRSSSWTDLPTAPNFDNGSNQAFGIRSGRSFYINRVWGGCPNDRGWMMVSTIDVCSWEVQTGDPADIIYSKLTTESHIPTAAETGYADTLVIFLR